MMVLVMRPALILVWVVVASTWSSPAVLGYDGARILQATAASPLPVSCNLANTTSQTILAATQKFEQANAACFALFDACKANKSEPSCDATCLSDRDAFGKACIDAGGHYCTSSTEDAGSALSPPFRLAEAFCLPPPCDKSQVGQVQAWVEAQNCGNLPQCAATVSCNYGYPATTIVAMVLVTLSAFGLCVFGAISFLRYRQSHTRMAGGDHVLLNNADDVDDEDL